MTPGFWFPALTNILRAEGLDSWVAIAFVVPPLCALVSPLVGGALADQRVAADRLFVWSSVIGAVAIGAAFACLDAGWNPWWFIFLLGVYSLASAPTWGLLATISLTHLPKKERQYPQVRLGATLGWMAAGVMTSYLLKADTSPVAGYASAVSKLVAAGCAWFLPRTPPLGNSRSWRKLTGLDAFRLMKQRDHCVFFAVTALFSVPLTAFYMFSAEQLKVLGDARPTATMTVAQWSEIAAMLAVGLVMARFRIKTLLAVALSLSAVRFGMSAIAGWSGEIAWHITGIALHGMCYTFYFITAQVFLDRRVNPDMKGQAQGLLGMVSGGFGPLVGALVCGWLHGRLVTPDGAGWAAFWGILAAMIVVCLVILLCLYRGQSRQADEGAADPQASRAAS
jgi:MFS family permease